MNVVLSIDAASLRNFSAVNNTSAPDSTQIEAAQFTSQRPQPGRAHLYLAIAVQSSDTVANIYSIGFVNQLTGSIYLWNDSGVAIIAQGFAAFTARGQTLILPYPFYLLGMRRAGGTAGTTLSIQANWIDLALPEMSAAATGRGLPDPIYGLAPFAGTSIG